LISLLFHFQVGVTLWSELTTFYRVFLPVYFYAGAQHKATRFLNQSNLKEFVKIDCPCLWGSKSVIFTGKFSCHLNML